MEQGGQSQSEGTASSHSSPEEKFSDNISSASEASESTSGSQYSHKKKKKKPYILPLATAVVEVFHRHGSFLV